VHGLIVYGKSSLLHELTARGYRTVDTDYGNYFQTIDGERLWRADRISALLSSAPDELPGVLFVQGTTRNQPREITARKTRPVIACNASTAWVTARSLHRRRLGLARCARVLHGLLGRDERHTRLWPPGPRFRR
jgi:hypothetical protein